MASNSSGRSPAKSSADSLLVSKAGAPDVTDAALAAVAAAMATVTAVPCATVCAAGAGCAAKSV